MCSKNELELECETILSPTVIPYEEFEKCLETKEQQNF